MITFPFSHFSCFNIFHKWRQNLVSRTKCSQVISEQRHTHKRKKHDKCLNLSFFFFPCVELLEIWFLNSWVEREEIQLVEKNTSKIKNKQVLWKYFLCQNDLGKVRLYLCILFFLLESMFIKICWMHWVLRALCTRLYTIYQVLLRCRQFNFEDRYVKDPVSSYLLTSPI